MFDFCNIERKLKSGGSYNQGWLVEIDSVENLMKWAKLQNDAVDIWFDLKDESNSLTHFTNEKSHLFKMKLEKLNKKEISLIDFCGIYDELLVDSKFKMLEKYGKIYINEVGGFCVLGNDGIIKERISLNQYIFPKTTLEKYTIKKWPNGTHYYISLNGSAVHLDGKEKWDSKKEAEEAISNKLKTLKTKEDLFNE